MGADHAAATALEIELEIGVSMKTGGKDVCASGWLGGRAGASGSGSGATASTGAGGRIEGIGGAGGCARMTGMNVSGATGLVGVTGCEARAALFSDTVESCTLSASKSIAAVISTPWAVRLVARITASAPRLSRTARSACRMSDPVWRVIFISILQLLQRCNPSSADRRDQSHLAVVRNLAPGQNMHARDTGANEPR